MIAAIKTWLFCLHCRHPNRTCVVCFLLCLDCILCFQNIMFYDMGAGSTVCTIVTYQTVKTKDSGTQPQLQILGVG